MKVLRYILQKEFRQIFRDKTILAMMTMVPIIQLMILPWAANYDVKNIKLAYFDRDHSTFSQKLIEKIGSSGYFLIEGYPGSYSEALQLIERGEVDLILEIPNDFEKKLVREGKGSLNIVVDAINGTKSAIGSSYLTSVLSESQVNSEVRIKSAGGSGGQTSKTIELTSRKWFNPNEAYKFYMVPGILVLLLTMIAGYLAALNIVREKEIGTIEQINVTPIKKWEFILGKLIPFWIMGIIVFTLGLLVMYFVYGIYPEGSIPTLYLFAAVYLVALLGFGLLISTISNTQIQAMFVAFFFVMIFILMSGLFTSIDSMPNWAKQMSLLTPVTHFIHVVRLVVLKGSSLQYVYKELLFLLAFAFGLNGLAIWNYRKTS